MSNLIRTTMFLVVAFWAAISVAQPPRAQSADYKLSPGDSIKVQVYQQPDLTVEARVSETGSISYPLVGSVKLGGLSISEAEKNIANALVRANILKQPPQVNIVLLQVRGNQVSVLGQVQKPGRFPLETNNVRVSDMLAAAGGVTATGGQRIRPDGTRDGKPLRRRAFNDIRRPVPGLPVPGRPSWHPATPSSSATAHHVLGVPGAAAAVPDPTRSNVA